MNIALDQLRHEQLTGALERQTAGFAAPAKRFAAEHKTTTIPVYCHLLDAFASRVFAEVDKGSVAGGDENRSLKNCRQFLPLSDITI